METIKYDLSNVESSATSIFIDLIPKLQELKKKSISSDKKTAEAKDMVIEALCKHRLAGCGDGRDSISMNYIVRVRSSIMQCRTIDQIIVHLNKSIENGKNYTKKVSAKMIDFTNAHIDGLTVIEPTGKRSSNGNIIWKCKCNGCGTELEVVSTTLNRALKNNTSIMCRVCARQKKAESKPAPEKEKTKCRVNYVGKKFDSFEVLSLIDSSGSGQFKCKCLTCGKEYTMSGSSIYYHSKDPKYTCKHGITKDLRKIKLDGITAIEPTDNRYYGYVVWKCRCDSCGKIFYAPYVNLLKAKSCGCKLKQVRKEFGFNNSATGKNKTKRMVYNIDGEYGIGYTRSGQEFKFDLEDFDLIKHHSWRISGSKNSLVTSMTVNKKQVKIHLLNTILHIPDNKKIKKITYKNGDIYDCRKDNIEVLFCK